MSLKHCVPLSTIGPSILPKMANLKKCPQVPEIYYVTYGSTLLTKWEAERQALVADTDFLDSGKLRLQLEALSLRYLTRCLIVVSEQKKRISFLDCNLESQDFVKVNRALNDLNESQLSSLTHLVTNVPSVLHNVHVFRKTLRQLKAVHLQDYFSALPLVKIPICEGQLNLLHLPSGLRLDKNDSLKLSKAVTSICGQKYMETIHIENCIFADTFQPEFTSSSFLVNLVLSGCSFPDNGEFLTILSNLKTLKHLDLRYCGLTDSCIPQLKEVFTSNQDMQYLNLADNDFGEKENELLKTVATLHKLSMLHLYHCNFSRSCSIGLNALFRGGLVESLKVLSLNFNKLMGNPETLLAISNCRALEELYLYNAQIMSRNCSSLKQILQQNRKLRVLDLSHNDLNGGNDMVFSLCVCVSLEKLGLYKTNLADSCIPSLAKVLQFNRKLKELNLSCNEFTEHAALFNALSQGRLLEKVYLRGTGIVKPEIPRRSLFDEAGKSEEEEAIEVEVKASGVERALAAFTSSAKKLRVLELGRNELWPKLLEALLKCSNLEKLFIYECLLSHESVPALTEVVKNNSKLRILDLEGNEISKTKDLFEVLQDSEIQHLDLRNMKISDQKILQIVSLIRSARNKHRRSANRAVSSATKVDKNKALCHIWISENSELTLDGLRRIMEEIDAPLSAGEIKSARGTEKTKAEVLQKMNSAKCKPYIH